MAGRDIFAELNQAIKANDGVMPDRFTVGGETFVRTQQRPGDAPVKKPWTNPKTQEVTEEFLEAVTIDVAPFADRVMLDGVIYLANRTYQVPKRLADTLRDTIAQTWRHEHQTGGAYSFGTAAGVRNAAHLSGRAGVGFAQ